MALYLESMMKGAKAQGWAAEIAEEHKGGSIAIARKEGEPLMILCGGDCPAVLRAADEAEARALLNARLAMLSGAATDEQLEHFDDAERAAENEWGSEIPAWLILVARKG